MPPYFVRLRMDVTTCVEAESALTAKAKAMEEVRNRNNVQILEEVKVMGVELVEERKE